MLDLQQYADQIKVPAAVAMDFLAVEQDLALRYIALMGWHINTPLTFEQLCTCGSHLRPDLMDVWAHDQGVLGALDDYCGLPVYYVYDIAE